MKASKLLQRWLRKIPVPQSFQWRLLLLTGITLGLFFVITTLILERAFAHTLREQMEARLETSVYTLLTAADENQPGKLNLPLFLRDERLNQIDSGIYAYVDNSDGKMLWRSASSIKRRAPPISAGPIGSVAFSERDEDDGHFLIGRSDVIWEGNGGHESRYTFTVMESTGDYDRSIHRFRRTAFSSLALAAFSLSLLLYFLLSWGMRPLRMVSRALNDIKSGRSEQILGEFPIEIRQLTDNINGFIASERDQRKRYAETMSNLAHSLKTPLAVMHTVIEREQNPDTLRAQAKEQVSRMHDIVRYQLQRAVTKGRSPLTAAVDIAPAVRQTVAALEKVYLRRNIQFALTCPDSVRFVGETGDFMEILGNLLDNAGKWAHQCVRVHVTETEAQRGHYRLHIDVEDDGPGIPKNKRPKILGRGERLDEKVEGQGIGLAVVTEIVAAYLGELKFGTSPDLGGAWIHIELPI